MKEATAVKGARQFIQLLDWGAGEVVERGGFVLKNKNDFFSSFERVDGRVVVGNTGGEKKLGRDQQGGGGDTD